MVNLHSNFVDLEPIFLYYYHGSCFVAKGEISKWPLIGTITKALQTIFVFRAEANSKSGTLDSISHRANDSQSWTQIVIFPGKFLKKNLRKI